MKENSVRKKTMTALNFNEEPFYMNNTADISDKMQRTVSSE